MTWLAAIYEFIVALPKLLEAIGEIFRFAREVQHSNEKTQNEEVKKELENVNSPDSAQKAADSVAGRFGS